MINNIVLIGMPGSGKSTVGVVLAKRLGYDFLDTDILLSKNEGKALSLMVDEYGYEGFLRCENDTGKNISREKTVIATGGSMVLCNEAMDNLKQNGVIVYLNVPVGELESRLPACLSERGIAAPLGLSVSGIFDMRRPLYEKYADVTIDCAHGVDAVAAQIDFALF